VLVDDGSSDSTVEVAEQYAKRMPLRILRHPQNKGLAETLNTGLREAVRVASPEDIIVTMDADNTQPPALIPRMVSMIHEGRDVVVGSRYRPGARVVGVPLYRRFLSYGASLLFRTLLPIRGVRDYTSGYRAYRAPVIKEMYDLYEDEFISETGFSCMVDILLKLRNRKFVFGEAPLVLRYDLKEGVSKMNVLKTVVDTLELAFRRFLKRA
jgi:dolichol-phosphate mannosyltransferase